MFSGPIIIFFLSMALRMAGDIIMIRMRAKERKDEMKLEKMRMQDKAFEKVRARMPAGLFGMTTAILAMFAFICILGIPKIAPTIGYFMNIEIPIFYAYAEESTRLFIFSGPETQSFKAYPGIPIFPMDIELMAAISGAFFGKVVK